MLADVVDEGLEAGQHVLAQLAVVEGLEGAQQLRVVLLAHADWIGVQKVFESSHLHHFIFRNEILILNGCEIKIDEQPHHPHGAVGWEVRDEGEPSEGRRSA
eukprot:XP_001707466.1 Hypothetical protein GL50803_31770 [Giardia lamblia ATCC 50803]